MYYHNCLGATLLHFCYTVLKLYDGWRFMSRKMVSTGHDASVIHRGRKQFPSSFLSGPAPLLCTTAGNFSPIVSCPAWHRCYAPRQETFHQWVPARLVASAVHHHKKLFAKGFSSDPWFLSSAAGNLFQPIKKPPRRAAFFIVLILQPELLHGKELLPVRRRFFCGLHQC